ncbi:hypothetical protein Bbelb_348100 [Branchiostoma belcheri]|nr:hypothetical protein Bbelb_348100 [Branchiostoma belcheri]
MSGHGALKKRHAGTGVIHSIAHVAVPTGTSLGSISPEGCAASLSIIDCSHAHKSPGSDVIATSPLSYHRAPPPLYSTSTRVITTTQDETVSAVNNRRSRSVSRIFHPSKQSGIQASPPRLHVYQWWDFMNGRHDDPRPSDGGKSALAPKSPLHVVPPR